MSPEPTPTAEHLAKVEAEQAALRRIAALVARSVPPAEVFDAVVDEVRSLMGVDAAALARYEADDTATLLAVSAEADARVASPGDKLSTRGTTSPRWSPAPGGPHASTTIRRPPAALTARPAKQVFSRWWSPDRAGNGWYGVLGVYSMHRPLPADTEARLADFAALVASAIANVQAWSELEASRVRIISAADEARRRVMRDLHDGAQQRIVALALRTRRLAQSQAAQDAGLDAELRSLDGRPQGGSGGTAHDRLRTAPCRPVARRPRCRAEDSRTTFAGPDGARHPTSGGRRIGRGCRLLLRRRDGDEHHEARWGISRRGDDRRTRQPPLGLCSRRRCRRG